MSGAPFPNVPKPDGGCDTAYGDMMKSEKVFADALETDPELADALNVGSCETSRSESSGEYCAGASAGGVCMGPKAELDHVEATTKGCESVAIQHSLSLGLNKSLNCTANTLQQQSRNESSTVQALRIKIKDSKVKGNFDLSTVQESSTDAKIIDFTSMEVQNEFENTVKQSLNSFQELAQSSETDSEFASGDSQKAFQSNVSAAISSAAKTNVTEVIKQTINSVVSKQGQDIEISGLEVDGDMNINLIQKSAQKIVIDSVTKAIVSDIMINSGMSEQVNAMSAAQTSIKKTQNTYQNVFGMLSFLFFIFIAAIIMFTIKRLGKKYNAASLRCLCFWTALLILTLMLAIPICREIIVIWIPSLILFVLAMGINTMELNKDSERISFGDGFKYVLNPYPKAKNMCPEEGDDGFCTFYNMKKDKDGYQKVQILESGLYDENEVRERLAEEEEGDVDDDDDDVQNDDDESEEDESEEDDQNTTQSSDSSDDSYSS
tara:strand:+ start:2421 stop:3896 length:1476 start_codon:yes stop_codon:yes gene_type:complete